eukprot:TRINITY_DN17957_c0_g1_i1.p1 TRINITY_DN17957_c0_g1~~TRINITY_DN17957_c0_g1_i1.p1  ORF type:complete len:141 (-),score=11.52 TRINITY_DN17957_c0_g1_i1:71-493(-)
MDRLPEELLVRIFSCLSGIYLASTQMVCTKWFRVLQTSTLWKSCYINECLRWTHNLPEVTTQSQWKELFLLEARKVWETSTPFVNSLEIQKIGPNSYTLVPSPLAVLQVKKYDAKHCAGIIKNGNTYSFDWKNTKKTEPK